MDHLAIPVREPHDEDLACRISELLADEPGVAEMRVFGGPAFSLGGSIAVVASSRGGLMVRATPGQADTLASEPHASPFEMGGRPMPGWFYVEPEGVATLEQLEPWLAHATVFARSLPPKC
jgi:TfoX N-terminal domain